MNQKIDRLGRLAAVFSSLVLGALLLNLWYLNAVADEKEELTLFEREHQITDDPQFDYNDVVVRQKRILSGRIFENFKPISVLPASLNAIACVYIDSLYLVNGQGKLEIVDTEKIDVPVLSNDNFIYENHVLIDENSRKALDFIATLQTYHQLWPLISQVRVNEKSMIAYFNFGETIPVIFGRDDWHGRINNLLSYIQQCGTSELIAKTLFLDLRVEDRIIVKKRV